MTAPFCEIETGRLLNFDLRVFQMVINFFRGTAVKKFLHRKTAIKSIPARFIILLNNPQKRTVHSFVPFNLKKSQEILPTSLKLLDLWCGLCV